MHSFANYSFFDSNVQAHHNSTMEVFNPYAFVPKQPKSSPCEYKPITSGTVQPTVSGRITRRKQSNNPTEIAKAATGKIVFKQKTCKADKHPNEDYGKFDPARQLYEDPTLATHKKDGRKAFWFFILSLLMDSSKKEIISWTGRGKEFRVIDKVALDSVWSLSQNYAEKVKTDSIRRGFNGCCKKRVMMPVKAQMRRYAFTLNSRCLPAIHLGMTPEELSNFIATNSEKVSSSNKNKVVKKAKNLTYRTPPPSSIDELNEFFCTPVSTVPIPDTVAPPTPVYTEASAFFNAELVHPLPIIDFNQATYSYDPYWNPPGPCMPEFVTPSQYQFPPACMRDYTNFPQGNNNY